MSDPSDGASVKLPPGSYSLGQALDWNAGWTPVVLSAELPFWLMVADCTLQVEVRGHSFTVDVRSNFIELFAGEVVDSRRTAVYLGPNPEQLNPEVRKGIEEQGVGLLPRACKTILRIHSRCNSDVRTAVDEEGGRANAGACYLMALCAAHFEVVNRVVQSYRLSTYDYFPYEASPWDIPVWRVVEPAGFVRVVLLNYADWDRKPRIGPMGGPTETYSLIEPAALQQAMLQDAQAGELELLDALNLMEHGDYTGAVRRITTAIEAIVEWVLRSELLKRYSEAEVEAKLHESRNDFPGRARQYEKLSGRQLDAILRQELEDTRSLRHEIVHRGLRISFQDRGRAQRSVDTGRWTFNWFENRPDRVRLRENRIGTRSIGRHLSLFDAEITSEGVVVYADPMPP